MSTDPFAALDAERRAAAVAYSEIEREKIEWLWPLRIPLGVVTLLVGDPGLGKSLLTCLLAARLSRGELTGKREVSLLATAEDHEAAVVRPRLEVAGADLDYVRAIRMRIGDLEDGLWLPDDLRELETLVAEHSARLIVIDPLMAHLPENVDSYRDQAVRLALAPLHKVAEKHAASVVVVAHLNKAKSADPLIRTGGSVGLTAAARSVLLLARDPDDPDGEQGSRRVLAQTKSNYGELAASLLLEIESVPLSEDAWERQAVIREAGETMFTGRELLAPPSLAAPKTEEAMAFLRDTLANGSVPSEQVKELAGREEIAPKTLRTAREKLGVVTDRDDSGHTRWVLPEPRAPLGGSGARRAQGGTKGQKAVGTRDRDETVLDPQAPRAPRAQGERAGGTKMHAGEQVVLAEIAQLEAEGIVKDITPRCQVCGARVGRPQLCPRPGGVFCSPACWQAQSSDEVDVMGLA